MEILNLHFALGGNAKTYFIQANGQTHQLKAYRDHPQKFAEHAKLNAALALIPAASRELVTHYVEEINLPVDHVSRLSIVSTSAKPGDILPDLEAVHMHIPHTAIRKGLLRATNEHIPFPLVLQTLGVKHNQLTAVNLQDVHAAASLIINSPLSTARAIVSHHPDLGTIDVDTSSLVFRRYMQDSNDFTQLINYISNNPGEASGNPWYVKKHAIYIDPDTKEELPMEPSDQECGDGESVDWPTLPGTSTKVIPLYQLSDEETGATDGGVVGAAKEAVSAVLRKVKNDADLKGELWSRPQGIISKKQANVAPVAPKKLRSDENAKWAVKCDSNISYGIDLLADELSFQNNTVAFPVRNWPNRILGVYVEYLDANGKPIPWSVLKNTKEGDNLVKPEGLISPALAEIFARHDDTTTRFFWGILGAGNNVFGIPFWTNPTNINFKWPHDQAGKTIASKARVYLGGFGIGEGFSDWDTEVDLAGLLLTGLVSYGVTAACMVFTVKVIGPLKKQLQEKEFYNAMLATAAGLGAVSAVVSIVFHKEDAAKSILSKLSTLVASIAFGKVTEKILVLAYKRQIINFQRWSFYNLTSQQVIQQAPFAGWALKLASIAADLCSMAATTIECGFSPATYKYLVEATMNVEVNVKPDPRHGTMQQDAIWPMVADHWVVTLKYPKGNNADGGLTYVKAGPMPAAHNAPLNVVFENVPAGGQVEVSAVVYSKTDWIAGRWDSGPAAADPGPGAKQVFNGAIVESLVPLVATTTYAERQRTGYNATTKKHTWVMTSFAVEEQYKADLEKGTLSDGFRSEFSGNGIVLPPNSDIGIQTIETGKQWHITDKKTNTKYRCFYTLIYTDGKDKKIYQVSVENLTRPAPPLPFPKTVCDTSGDGHNICQLVNISMDNKACQLGYVWKASGMNLPLDKAGGPPVNTQMYSMQSISTLNQPSDLIIQSKIGFSEMPFIAYNQFGLTSLFQVDFDKYSKSLDGANNKPVPADVKEEFRKRAFALTDTATVLVATAGRDWRIMDKGATIYHLVLNTDVVDGVWKYVISIFNYIIAGFTNFYLDSRIAADGRYHLRSVSFNDGKPGSYEFDADFPAGAKNSWGSFPIPKGSTLYKIAVHPAGCVIGIDFGLNKLWKLKLPEKAATMKEAPVATALSGSGELEGLISRPKGLTIAADGRIIVLEEGNKRFQSFDVNGNPVAGFKGSHAFTMAGELSATLDEKKVTDAIRKLYQSNLPLNYLRAKQFSIDEEDVLTDMDKGVVNDELRSAFKKNTFELPEESKDIELLVNKKGASWLLTNKTEPIAFDLRHNATDKTIDVYYEASLDIETVAPQQEWLLVDSTNTHTFRITKSKPDSPEMNVQELIATAKLREQTGRVEYLDVAVEDKGYIYVLFFEADGSAASQYMLDIYNPDGTPLLSKPLSGIAAAKMTVDKWRTLWTLNYEKYPGPGNRTEPTVSGWIPSTTKS